MASEITIRQARAGDLAAVEALSAALHRLEGVDMAADARRAAIAPLLSPGGPGAIWAAEAGEGVVGFAAISFGWSIEFGGRDAFLDELCVAERRRGQGIGALLLDEAKAGLAALGAHALHLEVGVENQAAQGFYAARGFRLRDGYHLMSARIS